ILYLGDTGSDKLERSVKLQQLWKVIAPLVQTKKLKAIIIEVSFSNEQPDHLLFGHLTPQLLIDELIVLSSFSEKEALKNFQVVITHMKPFNDREAIIKKQLQTLNTLGVNFIFPEQGKQMRF